MAKRPTRRNKYIPSRVQAEDAITTLLCYIEQTDTLLLHLGCLPLELAAARVHSFQHVHRSNNIVLGHRWKHGSVLEGLSRTFHPFLVGCIVPAPSCQVEGLSLGYLWYFEDVLHAYAVLL